MSKLGWAELEARMGLLGMVMRQDMVMRLLGARWCVMMQSDLAEWNSRRCWSLILHFYYLVPLATLVSIFNLM